MSRSTRFALMLSAAMLWGCSHTVVVPVPPRMELQGFGTLGIVEFTSNSTSASTARPRGSSRRTFTRRNQARASWNWDRAKSCWPRWAAASSTRAALRKIGEKYGVDAIFIGNVAYSDPRTDVKVTDSSKLEGSLRVEVPRGLFPAGWWKRAAAPTSGAARPGRDGPWAA